MKRAALHNLGCKVNSYEIEVMEQELIKAGFEIVPFEEKADIYIVNTCSVTNIADRKSRQMLHKAKKENPESLVVAVGCYVQGRTEEEVIADGVDLVIGNNRKKDIVRLLDSYMNDCGDELDNLIDINATDEYEDAALRQTGEHTRAYIKVQDGCNQFCSYCIIPFVRGRVRSRDKDSVVSEIKGLVQKGCKEFVLTGIHLSSYGYEKGTDWLSSSKLIDLIETTAQIDGVDRIRLGSLEPRIITEDFVKRLSAIDKICPHFHLSLQSGCDATLTRMNRHYTAQEYLESVELLRRYFTEANGCAPAMTTDVIVGFPGETQEEFEECRSFLEKIGFYETHIFKYSKRKGTRAAVMSGQLTEAQKAARSRELLMLNEKNKAAYIDEIISAGVLSQLLVEEETELDGVRYQVGYTKEYIRAAFQADEDLSGQIVEGRLERSTLVESGQQICIFRDIRVKS